MEKPYRDKYRTKLCVKTLELIMSISNGEYKTVYYKQQKNGVIDENMFS